MVRVPEAELRYDAERGLHCLGARPFTGVAWTTWPDGSPMSESTYEDGLLSGLSRGWWPSGVLEVESHYALGALHGRSRQWYTSGRLAEDERWEHGILVTARRWSEDGALVEALELSPSDPAWASLMLARRAAAGQGRPP